MSYLGCQTPPRACPTLGEVSQDLELHTTLLHQCLADKTILLHELKACQERR